MFLLISHLPFRYLSKPRDALKHFNAVRKDSKWSAQALMHMAEVVLNPDNDAAWGQVS